MYLVIVCPLRAMRLSEVTISTVRSRAGSDSARGGSSSLPRQLAAPEWITVAKHCVGFLGPCSGRCLRLKRASGTCDSVDQTGRNRVSVNHIRCRTCCNGCGYGDGPRHNPEVDLDTSQTSAHWVDWALTTERPCC